MDERRAWRVSAATSDATQRSAVLVFNLPRARAAGVVERNCGAELTHGGLQPLQKASPLIRATAAEAVGGSVLLPLYSCSIADQASKSLLGLHCTCRCLFPDYKCRKSMLILEYLENAEKYI